MGRNSASVKVGDGLRAISIKELVDRLARTLLPSINSLIDRRKIVAKRRKKTAETLWILANPADSGVQKKKNSRKRTQRTQRYKTNMIAELKACRALVNEHTAQILGYLRSARKEHGLLMNFGSYKFQIRKYAMSSQPRVI
jgi:PD-(D/E)XK nuclease superfamily